MLKNLHPGHFQGKLPGINLQSYFWGSFFSPSSSLSVDRYFRNFIEQQLSTGRPPGELPSPPLAFPIPCLQEFASFLFVLPTTREPDDRLGSLPLKTDLLQKYLITCSRSFQPCSATIFTAFITNSTESSDIKYGKLSRTKPGLGRTCELIFILRNLHV